MHINTGFGFYFDRGFEDRVATITRQSVGHKVVAMNAMTEMILSGVFERFPRLKMVLAEFEIGWIPFWLEDLDRKFDRREDRQTPLAPSEYFNRQIYATFTQDGVGGYLAQRWGTDNFMWSNDYPHPGGIWPHSDDTIALTLGGLAPEARAKVVGQTVARLYGMPIPEPMPRGPVVDPEPIETVWHRPWVKKRGEYTFDKPTMGL
jgi:predicted TIM-barrel fold metal-dependent hydrolase